MAYVHTFLLFCTWFSLEMIFAQDNIVSARVLRDSETLESSNAFFKLGFFSPVNSTNRYVGIWYSNMDSDGLEVVWVANRGNPLNDTSGVLKISDDGNLQVLNAQNKSFWSSNITGYKADNSVAQLLNTGNLVLLSNAVGTIVWQSFDHPTDSFLPQMKFSIDESLGEKQVPFRSWKSPSDPSGGNFTVGIDTRTPPEVFLWNGDHPKWRNGPWNGNVFIGVDSVLSILNDNEGKIYFGFSLGNQSSLGHFVVNYDGNLVQKDWDYGSRKWVVVWMPIQSECDVYGKCGAFGSCKSTNSPSCVCLGGFVPKNNEEWKQGNWTDGCVRRTALQCGSTGDRADGFWKLKNMKVPDDAVWLSANSEDGCSSLCLGNCSCLAYSYFSSIGCMTWNGRLIDIEEYIDNRGIDLSIRLAYSELGKINQQQGHHGSVTGRTGKWRIIVIVGVAVGTTLVGIFMCYLRIRWLRRHHGTRVTSKKIHLGSYMLKDTREVQFGDLPFFGLENLVTATNNFREDNKLGRGGFGTVYKGKLEDGQEIAVKRLSKASSQGLQEFMNEVLVISKLQHRNLVKLLGCCAEGEEKMLVYEYMPNKSLDALLFDPIHRELLDWKKRFNIIQGICRGLLYLHRDSRLKIVHRDLKPSNILLDANLAPKISDFGMARIFGGNQDQADTKRVVGTYGYMSPEYAMEGRFSEKSDVFSFGVLLLEIVTGRKNGSFNDEESLSLLGHAWKLWNEDDIVSLIDPTINQSSSRAEILRCIHVALLCVPEFPEDRPSMSTIISMIDNEVTNLPRPTQPGFTQRRIASCDAALGNDLENNSANRVSLSYLSGR